ncbi:hypothetical protein Cantr_03545 [Candida viswanathii]|uniref:Uncharacterized protein n=1 Tax=Candida viswanathii TaxID=5486 RepID=A0A367YL81_9ASCO|nr:hypothetical protein Cantr_03545 [Candida viswanathii]
MSKSKLSHTHRLGRVSKHHHLGHHISDDELQPQSHCTQQQGDTKSIKNTSSTAHWATQVQHQVATRLCNNNIPLANSAAFPLGLPEPPNHPTASDVTASTQVQRNKCNQLTSLQVAQLQQQKNEEQQKQAQHQILLLQLQAAATAPTATATTTTTPTAATTISIGNQLNTLKLGDRVNTSTPPPPGCLLPRQVRSNRSF